MKFHQVLSTGAKRYPNRRALHWIDQDRYLTYAQATSEMERIAGALSSIGVTKGDRVAIFANNGIDYALAMFGTWRVGAISAHINVQYAESLDYYLNDCTPKVLIYTHEQLPVVRKNRANAKSVKHYICFDGDQEGAIGLEELIRRAPAPPEDLVSDTDGAHLSYTSGTSGNPKGVLLGHEPTMRACRCIAERLGMNKTDVTYGPSTLSSSYHLVANLLPGLFAGALVGVVTKWNAEKAWDDMERLGTTVIPTNATLLTELLEECRRRGRPPKALRLGISGGGPVPPQLKRAWRDELRITLAESYGQSELGGFVGLGPLKALPDEKLLACGPSLPDREVRIVDPITKRETPVGQVGDIAIAGGHMIGYWGRPEKSQEVASEGWLYTGDVGRMDEDGFVYVRGRSSERLTVAGEAWYPRDIEEAVMEHPAIRSAALIGLPDPKIGEKPVLYVVSRNAAKADETDLVRHVEGRIRRDLSLLSINWVDSLPLTPTGKISKAELKRRSM